MVVVFVGFLFLCSLFDICFQKIPSIIIWGFIVIMAGYRMGMYVSGITSVGEMVGLLLPGIFLYVLSLISEEIGNGDGLLIVATGCYLGVIKNMVMVILAFLLAMFVSMCILIKKRKAKNIRIAFAPFLLFASLIIVLGL